LQKFFDYSKRAARSFIVSSRNGLLPKRMAVRAFCFGDVSIAEKQKPA
jgi:hypothetical protein